MDTLLQLDDKSLQSACKSNTYLTKLCQNQHLWRNKIINKFGIDLIGYVDDYKRAYINLNQKGDIFMTAAENGYLPIIKKYVSEIVISSDAPNIIFAALESGNSDISN